MLWQNQGVPEKEFLLSLNQNGKIPLESFSLTSIPTTKFVVRCYLVARGAGCCIDFSQRTDMLSSSLLHPPDGKFRELSGLTPLI